MEKRAKKMYYLSVTRHKFDQETTVRVTGGTFKGVVGKVARYQNNVRTWWDEQEEDW